MLESRKNKRHFVGTTDDLKRRFEEHNKGTGGSYTSKNRPFKLVFYEAYLHKKDASKAERFYKSGYGKEILREKLKDYLKSDS